MEAFVYFFAAVLAGGYVYAYAKTVVLVRRKHGQKAYPQFEPRSAGGLPPQVSETFDRKVPQLEAMGFRVVGYFYLEGLPQDETTDVDLYIALLKNEEAGDFASLFEVFAAHEHVKKHEGIVGFATDFADGTTFRTSNSKLASSFKADPENPSFKFPGVDDPRLLYRAHRGLLARHAPGRRGVLPSPGLEVVHLSHAETVALRRQAEFGYFYFDEAADLFRPTWRGACVMVAKQMPGVADVLRAADRARASRALASLGERAA
jgi:hypothetical protein